MLPCNRFPPPAHWVARVQFVKTKYQCQNLSIANQENWKFEIFDDLRDTDTEAAGQSEGAKPRVTHPVAGITRVGMAPHSSHLPRAFRGLVPGHSNVNALAKSKLRYFRGSERRLWDYPAIEASFNERNPSGTLIKKVLRMCNFKACALGLYWIHDLAKRKIELKS